MKTILLVFASAAGLYAQCGVTTQNPQTHIIDCLGANGQGAVNPSAFSAGAVTSLTLNTSALRVANTQAMLVQCWTGTTTFAPVAITSLNPVTVAGSIVTVVTPNFSSTANVYCTASSNSGAGPTGPVGSTGPTGPSGVAGPSGPSGANGTAGATGATGAASTVPGPTGPSGPAGAAGAAGPTGATGPSGTSGSAGATGATGPQGPSGVGGTPYLSALIAGPDTSKTITGATHGYTTPNLTVIVWDNSVPRNVITTLCPVNASTFDVTCTFNGPQSNYYIGINGGVGIQGPTGPSGPAGTNGAAGATGPSGALGPSGPAGNISSSCPGAGTGTAFTSTCSPTMTYTTGKIAGLLPNVDCTGGATTVNFDGLGTKSLKLANGTTDPYAGACTANSLALVQYDGTLFRIVGQFDVTHSSATLYSGFSTGSMGLAAHDAAGTASTLYLPTNTSTATSGYVLSITGSTTCDTHIPAFMPGSCYQATWVAQSSGSPSVGSNGASQTSDGAGHFLDGGCTMSSGILTCGASFKASGGEITAPSTPASSTGVAYFDSTNHVLSEKANNSATVRHTVQTSSCSGSTPVVGNINADGSVTCSAGPTLPFATPGSSHTFSGPYDFFECTTTCTLTMPVPSAGVQYCARNANNVSTVITFAAIGSSARYENPAFTSYGTAGTGTFVSSGAVTNRVCFIGKDSTHFDIVSLEDPTHWTAN